MSKFHIVKYSSPPEAHFEYRTAAFLASVSVQFILQCEREELIRCFKLPHGRKGLCVREIKKLKLIRHLHEDMGLDFDAVDFVLRYRSRLLKMQQQVEDLKQQMREKENSYEAEIMELRRQLTRNLLHR